MANIPEALGPLVEGATQRDKIVISTRLGKPFSEVMADRDLILAAMVWLKSKGEPGGGDWDKALDMTDEQAVRYLGILDEADEDPKAETSGEPSDDI